MLIKNWEELSKIPNESSTHVLEIDLDAGNAWLRAKTPSPYVEGVDYMEQLPHLDVYLSTHTFYRSQYDVSSRVLQACGFDVELDNWDKHDAEQ